MLQVSKKVDYGVMVLASLPEQGTPDFRSIHDIASEKNLSEGYLHQVMMPLKKAGLVSSREGVGGGYQLSRPGSEITLADIFDAVEGNPQFVDCQKTEKQCACENTCPTKNLWGDLQTMMVEYLNKKTLADYR